MGTVDCDNPKFTKERIAWKLKYTKRKYRRAVDLGRKSGGGKFVMSFFISLMISGQDYPQ